MQEYYRIFIMLLICAFLVIIIFLLSYMVKMKNYNSEKLATYECGFQPFEDSRRQFDVKFYLVAILFIIFDLEIVYLFPWALSIDQLNMEGMISMIIFLFILTIGFIYEWRKGALDW